MGLESLIYFFGLLEFEFNNKECVMFVFFGFWQDDGKNTRILFLVYVEKLFFVVVYKLVFLKCCQLKYFIDNQKFFILVQIYEYKKEIVT